VIVDASVAAKWFVRDEDLRVEALAVRDAALDERIRLAAPAIIWTEVANAIVRAARRERIARDRVSALKDKVQVVHRLVDGIAVDPGEIIATALEVGIGAHDATYLAAARQAGSSVITADVGMLEHGRAHGYDVVWLGDVTLRDGVPVDTPQGYQG
jgi:predicted nucleic acid-binding protein